jgi:thiol-disulfide isomerase/thioredoxin
MNAESNGQKSLPTKWIVGAIAAVLVVIAGIAIVGGGSDDGGSANDSDGSGAQVTTSPDDSADGSADGAAGGVAGEFQPVTATGEALVPLEESVPAPGSDPAEGVAAPVLSGFDFAGAPVSVAPSGKPVLLVFLAHWCPHCNAEIPRLIEWKESGQMPDSLEVVGIATGSRDDQANWPPSQWLVDKEWPWAVMADSEAQDAAYAMGVSGYPGLVLLDGDGTVLARRSGEASVSELNDWVSAAMPSA